MILKQMLPILLRRYLLVGCDRVEPADEWEGYYTFDDGDIECGEDIPAYSKGV